MSAASDAVSPRALRGLVPGWLRDLVLRSVAILAILLAWDLVGRAELLHPFLLPPLEEVAARLVADIASLEALLNAGLTLYRALVGFAWAVLVGVPAGILIARSAWVRWFCDPLLSMGLPMPKIAFLPIFMLWFGLYDLSKIVMVAFAAVFAIAAAAQAGTAGVDRFLIWSAESLGADRRHIFFHIIAPAALPQIFTGLQVAMPIALITAVASEMLMGGQGLGGAMLQAGRYADSPGVYAGIIETAVVGLAVVSAMGWLRRRLLAWHAEGQRR